MLPQAQPWTVRDGGWWQGEPFGCDGFFIVTQPFTGKRFNAPGFHLAHARQVQIPITGAVGDGNGQVEQCVHLRARHVVRQGLGKPIAHRVLPANLLVRDSLKLGDQLEQIVQPSLLARAHAGL